VHAAGKSNDAIWDTLYTVIPFLIFINDRTPNQDRI
jgi:hypothetical protein